MQSTISYSLFSICAEDYHFSIMFWISPQFWFLFILTTGVLCCREFEAVTRLAVKSNDHWDCSGSEDDNECIPDQANADQMKVSSDPDLDTVWQLLTTTGSSPSNFGLTVAYVSIILRFVWVSSYFSCEYDLTFHVSTIVRFTKSSSSS